MPHRQRAEHDDEHDPFNGGRSPTKSSSGLKLGWAIGLSATAALGALAGIGIGLGNMLAIGGVKDDLNIIREDVLFASFLTMSTAALGPTLYTDTEVPTYTAGGFISDTLVDSDGMSSYGFTIALKDGATPKETVKIGKGAPYNPTSPIFATARTTTPTTTTYDIVVSNTDGRIAKFYTPRYKITQPFDLKKPASCDLTTCITSNTLLDAVFGLTTGDVGTKTTDGCHIQITITTTTGDATTFYFMWDYDNGAYDYSSSETFNARANFAKPYTSDAALQIEYVPMSGIGQVLFDGTVGSLPPQTSP
jgi:hypothetical protein